MSLRYDWVPLADRTLHLVPCHVLRYAHLSDTRVYEPQIRARLGTTAQFCEVDSCITQLKAQGRSRTCNESKETEEDTHTFRAQNATFQGCAQRESSLLTTYWSDSTLPSC